MGVGWAKKHSLTFGSTLPLMVVEELTMTQVVEELSMTPELEQIG